MAEEVKMWRSKSGVLFTTAAEADLEDMATDYFNARGTESNMDYVHTVAGDLERIKKCFKLVDASSVPVVARSTPQDVENTDAIAEKPWADVGDDTGILLNCIDHFLGRCRRLDTRKKVQDARRRLLTRDKMQLAYAALAATDIVLRKTGDAWRADRAALSALPNAGYGMTERDAVMALYAAEKGVAYERDAISYVEVERCRQVKEKGYDAKHDDQHVMCELLTAAHYIIEDVQGVGGVRSGVDSWMTKMAGHVAEKYRDDSRGPKSAARLTIAAAMTCAEIDRLIRKIKKADAPKGDAEVQTDTLYVTRDDLCLVWAANAIETITVSDLTPDVRQKVAHYCRVVFRDVGGAEKVLKE